jgi:hypothetical protein
MCLYTNTNNYLHFTVKVKSINVLQFGIESWNSPAYIAMSYRLDVQGSIPDRDKRFFSDPQCADWLIQPSTHQVQGAFALGIKQLGHEADHSFPFSAEVNNGGAIPALSHTSS